MLLLAAISLLANTSITSGKGHIWAITQLITTTAGVILPIWMIVTTGRLRAYVKRNITNTASFLFEPITSVNCKRRSPKVEPVA